MLLKHGVTETVKWMVNEIRTRETIRTHRDGTDMVFYGREIEYE